MKTGKVLPFAKGLDLKNANDCATYLNSVKLAGSGIKVIDAVESLKFKDGTEVSLRGDLKEEDLIKAANELFFYLKENKIETDIG